MTAIERVPARTYLKILSFIFLILLDLFLLVPSTISGQRDFIEAEKRAQSKDFEGALDIYRSILDDDPSSYRALIGRGKVLSWMGRYGESRRAFRNLLRLYPDDVEALIGIAESYALGLQYGKAIQMMEDLRETRPGDLEVLAHLAKYNLLDGNREGALLYANMVLAKDPDYPEALEVNRRASSFSPVEIFGGYGYLNITNDDDGNNLYGGIRYQPGQSYTLFGRVDFLDRLGEKEGRFKGQGTWKLSEKLQLSIDAVVAPGADVYPEYSGRLKFSSPATLSWVISGSLQVSHFSSANDYRLSIGGEYFPYGYLSIFSGLTLSRTEFEILNDTTDPTIMLKTTWFISDLDRIYLYMSYGNGGNSSETIDMIGNIQAKILGIGGTHFFQSRVGISPSFEFQERGKGKRYYQFALEISYRL
jgi:YaiO family outer membrane protein